MGARGRGHVAAEHRDDRLTSGFPVAGGIAHSGVLREAGSNSLEVAAVEAGRILDKDLIDSVPVVHAAYSVPSSRRRATSTRWNFPSSVRGMEVVNTSFSGRFCFVRPCRSR